MNYVSILSYVHNACRAPPLGPLPDSSLVFGGCRNGAHTASVTALTPVILLRFNKEGFNECLRLCPAAAAEFRLRLVRPL